MRSCKTCRRRKHKSFLTFDMTGDYGICTVRNGWYISHPVLRALTCPAYENGCKLVDDWRESHDAEDAE